VFSISITILLQSFVGLCPDIAVVRRGGGGGGGGGVFCLVGPGKGVLKDN
jgi:hypothetical protein